jgi:hypothetical protein
MVFSNAFILCKQNASPSNCPVLALYQGTALQTAEKVCSGQESNTSGAKAQGIFNQFTARLKSCPDTKLSFSAACLVWPQRH